MTQKDEALRMAIEAMENEDDKPPIPYGIRIIRAINACKAALSDPETVTLPDGWVAVPVEPTDEMVRSACDCQDHDPEDGYESEVYYCYKAMLKAAPTLKEKG